MAMLRQLSAQQLAFGAEGWHNRDMRDDQKPHPGLWRVMQVDSGIAGIAIAAGFVVLGLVSMPTLAPIFLFGAVPFWRGSRPAVAFHKNATMTA
jgi:hypothetical protein